MLKDRLFKNPFYAEEDDYSGGEVDNELQHEEGNGNEEEHQQEEGQQEETVLDQDEDKVPLSTLLKYKNEAKELKKQLKRMTEKELDSEVVNKKNEILTKYKQAGYSEEFVELLAEDLAHVYGESKRSKLVKDDEDYFTEEINDLAKDKFFEDAPTYKKEIQQRISEYKKKGIDLSIEDAYISLRGKARLRELQTDTEQKALLNRRNVEQKAKMPNSTPTSPKNPYPLDEADKKALANLQKAQPNSGWTAEKYFKLMKG